MRPAFGFLLLFFCLAASAQNPDPPTSQVVPHFIKYSGALEPAQSGQAVSLTFAIYDKSDSPSPLWVETQSVTLDATAHYQTLLGSAVALPDNLFANGDAKWLGIQADGKHEQPRVELVSVPYALKAADAETLGGKPASAFVLADDGSNPSPKAQRLKGDAEASKASPQPTCTSGSGCATTVSTLNATTNAIAKFSSTAGELVNSAVFDDGSGHVGIGTTSPSLSFGSGLDIYDPSVGSLQLQGGTASYDLLSIGSNGNFGLYDSANAAYRFYLTSAGNIGIGTTSPAQKLDVNGNIALSSSANNGGIAGFNVSGDGVTRAGVNMANLIGLADSSKQGAYLSADTRSGQSAFAVWTRPASSATETERVSVLGNGNVGIGTTSPASTLQVVGNTTLGLPSLTNSLTVLGNSANLILFNSTASSYGGLRIYNDQNVNTRALEIDYSGSTYPSTLVSGGPMGESASLTTTGAFPLTLGTSNTARVTISSSGRVGIGTTSPASTLDVSGTANVSGNAVVGSLQVGGTSGGTVQNVLVGTVSTTSATVSSMTCPVVGTASIPGATFGDPIFIDQHANGVKAWLVADANGGVVSVYMCNNTAGNWNWTGIPIKVVVFHF